MELIDTSIKKIPFFIYGNVNVKNTVAYFNYYLDYGYNYFLQNIVSRSAFFDVNGNINSPIDIFLRQPSKNRDITDEYTDISLMSSPGNQGVYQNTNTATGKISPNGKLKNQVNIDLLFQNRDTISFKLVRSGYEENAVFNTTTPDNFIDIILRGYYLPEPTLQMWS